MEYIYLIIGNFFYNIYKIIPDYGFTIIILTILVKTALLPFAIKQHRSIVDMQKLQPQLEEIRKKYLNDRNKMNEETMKLYAEHKVNPLGGCFPALIQFPVFIALYQVITQPLKYILKFSENELYGINYALNSLIKPNVITSQINMIEAAKNIVSKVDPQSIIQGLVFKIQNLADLKYLMINLNAHEMGNLNHVAQLIKSASEISMEFLNIIDLSQTPNIRAITPVIIIPFLAAITTYLSSVITNKTSMSTSSTDKSMQQTMTTMMPIMTLFFTFSFPAGLGLYWIVSNIYQMIQQYLINKFIPREVTVNK